MVTGSLVAAYFFLVYGITNLLVNGMGPYGVIDTFREWCGKISRMLGEMLDCMMCTGNNVGLVLSAIDLFAVTGLSFTPFNAIFGGDASKFWLILPFDAALSSGVCWMMHWVTEFFHTNSAGYDE